MPTSTERALDIRIGDRVTCRGHSGTFIVQEVILGPFTAPYVRLKSTSFGHKTITVHKDQISAITRFRGAQTHEDCAARLHPGDLVRIVKPANVAGGIIEPQVWANAWVSDMDASIGRYAQIVRIDSHGVVLKEVAELTGTDHKFCYTYPAHGLQRILLLPESAATGTTKHHPAFVIDAPDPESTPDPEEINPMKDAAPMIRIEHKTFVNGIDVRDLSTEAIVGIIDESEQTISRLNTLRAKPKQVAAKITELQTGIDSLVALLDSRPDE